MIDDETPQDELTQEFKDTVNNSILFAYAVSDEELGDQIYMRLLSRNEYVNDVLPDIMVDEAIRRGILIRKGGKLYNRHYESILNLDEEERLAKAMKLPVIRDSTTLLF